MLSTSEWTCERLVRIYCVASSVVRRTPVVSRYRHHRRGVSNISSDLEFVQIFKIVNREILKTGLTLPTES